MLTNHRRTAHPHRTRRASALLLTGLLTTVALPVALAGPAAAHDRLESTNPADGSTVDVAPDAVVLTMSSAPLALGTQVQVTNPAGVVSTGDPQIVDETITQPLGESRAAGSYEVQWRVTSSDGHPISGSFTFTATTGVGDTTITTTEAPSPTVGTTTSEAPSSPGTVDPSNPTADDGNGALIGIGAAIVVVGAGAGGIIGYRRRQR